MGDAKRRREQAGPQKIEPEQYEVMNRLAATLDVIFKPYGFALLVFPMGGDDGRMNYISNAARETMIVALKELVARFEGRVAEPTSDRPQ